MILVKNPQGSPAGAAADDAVRNAGAAGKWLGPATVPAAWPAENLRLLHVIAGPHGATAAAGYDRAAPARPSKQRG